MIPRKAPRPLDGLLYTDPAIFDEEMERIFSRMWVCGGRLEELDEPGRFVTREIGGESIIAVRTAAGDAGPRSNGAAAANGNGAPADTLARLGRLLQRLPPPGVAGRRRMRGPGEGSSSARTTPGPMVSTGGWSARAAHEPRLRRQGRRPGAGADRRSERLLLPVPGVRRAAARRGRRRPPRPVPLHARPARPWRPPRVRGAGELEDPVRELQRVLPLRRRPPGAQPGVGLPQRRQPGDRGVSMSAVQ